MSLHKVFVYGTLKRNEPNHQCFQKDVLGKCQFLASATTVEKYPLIIATIYNIPFLLYKPGMGHNVEGELYEVDERVLANLDILEDHPNFYIREKRKVLTADGPVDAWIYFIQQFRDDLLAKQMFHSYSNNGAHGLKYVERYLRDPQITSSVIKSTFSEAATLEDL